jgi:hypothetical protein
VKGHHIISVLPTGTRAIWAGAVESAINANLFFALLDLSICQRS